MDIQNTIQKLREELNQHNYNYYVLDAPTISDFEFDQKLKQLQELENKHPEYFDENSPTQRVGGTITKNFQTVKHEYRMYSLDNSYSKEELLENKRKEISQNAAAERATITKDDYASRIQLINEKEREFNEKYGNYKEDLLLNGYYIDAHCPRPYDECKREIDELVELIFKTL